MTRPTTSRPTTSRPVYSTSSETARMHRTGLTGMTRVANAPVYICSRCGHETGSGALAEDHAADHDDHDIRMGD